LNVTLIYLAEPWSVAVQRIVEKGVPCTVAAGKDGSYGLFSASSAAEGIGVTDVGSVDNILIPLFLFPGTLIQKL